VSFVRFVSSISPSFPPFLEPHLDSSHAQHTSKEAEGAFAPRLTLMMDDHALGDLYDASVLNVARRRLEEEERLLRDSVFQLGGVSLVVPE